MKTWEGMSWHGYQLAEQTIKIDAGKTWQSAGTRWLTTAKTGYDLGVKKKRVRLAPGTTLHGYDLTSILQCRANLTLLDSLGSCESIFVHFKPIKLVET